MDNAIWIVTIIAHVAILAIIVCRRIYLPVFAFTILFGIVESPALYHVLNHGSHQEYFLLYYAFDLINVLLYVGSILETRCLRHLEIIAFSMSIYLVPKALSYFALIAHWHRMFSVANHVLHYSNIACLATWMMALAMYSVQATHPKSGAFMEPIEEEIPVVDPTPEEPKPFEPEPEFKDPGAPTP